MAGTRLTLLLVAVALTASCGGGDDGTKADGTSGPTGATRTNPTTPSSPPTDERSRTAPGPDDPGAGAAAPGTGGPGAPRESRGGACLRGSYVSTSFTGTRSVDSPLGAIALSGRGRGLGLDLTESRWKMRGVGSRPMRGKALGIDGTLKVNGTAHGRLVGAHGDRVVFRQTGSRGTVTLTGLGQTFELPVSVVAPAVVPDGRATVTCTGRRLRIDSVSGVLRLTRR